MISLEGEKRRHAIAVSSNDDTQCPFDMAYWRRCSDVDFFGNPKKRQSRNADQYGYRTFDDYDNEP